jgi:hypothetical protein
VAAGQKQEGGRQRLRLLAQGECKQHSEFPKS